MDGIAHIVQTRRGPWLAAHTTLAQERTPVSIEPLLMELKEAEVHLELVGDDIRWRAPPGSMTPQRRQLLANHKTGLVDCLRRRALVASVRTRLRDAVDWSGLTNALEEADRAFCEGQITLESANELAREAGERSRQLPERAGP